MSYQVAAVVSPYQGSAAAGRTDPTSTCTRTLKIQSRTQSPNAFTRIRCSSATREIDPLASKVDGALSAPFPSPKAVWQNLGATSPRVANREVPHISYSPNAMVTCIDTATAVAAAAAAVQANTPNVQQRIPFRKDSLPVTPQSTVSNQRTQFQQRLEETISDRCTQLLQRLEVLEQRFDYEEGVVRPIIWRRLEAFEQCLANEASKNHEGGNTVHIAKSWPEEPRRKEPRPSAATEPTDDFRSLQCSVSILQDTCVSHSEALDRSLADLSGLKEEVKCSIAEDIREKVFNVAQRVGSELWSERRERIQGQQLLQDTLQSQQELLTQLAAFVDRSLGARSSSTERFSHGVKTNRNSPLQGHRPTTSPTQATRESCSMFTNAARNISPAARHQ
mmetsp:Transcript_107290/g.207884  ORF Transcript_107290/g.207884 Transcript_107290/m.207884 type:complete len:392 (+) Transcript_107290:66-1241(+)